MMYQKAVTSCVLGMMSIFLPFIGILFGWIGLLFANKALVELTTDAPGYRFALGGKICSVVGLCLQVCILIFILAAYFFFMNLNLFM
ncbi:DUF4190 domain-containing protein [Halobacillus sp. HZG1]|uniref:DUF4190 domain-containing protein n=1 Tax=Halobacillus sp. HZG1 TaxID=3111769 RepID=UPI002DBFD6C6|nr:DUF4190 domain-containing protein [Halobacillus sp. HZG1]MEC3882320.1 DUF4190 domain-containing protein [Halobacillus sp. HZG1]